MHYRLACTPLPLSICSLDCPTNKVTRVWPVFEYIIHNQKSVSYHLNWGHSVISDHDHCYVVVGSRLFPCSWNLLLSSELSVSFFLCFQVKIEDHCFILLTHHSWLPVIRSTGFQLNFSNGYYSNSVVSLEVTTDWYLHAKVQVWGYYVSSAFLFLYLAYWGITKHNINNSLTSSSHSQLLFLNWIDLQYSGMLET